MYCAPHAHSGAAVTFTFEVNQYRAKFVYIDPKTIPLYFINSQFMACSLYGQNYFSPS